MKPRNIVAVVLILISFVALIPGLTWDLITIRASVSPFPGAQPVELFSMTRSILQTVRTLHESGDDFVAGLILLFSVIVPFVKGILLLLALAMRRVVARHRIFGFVKAISKWAMADVFVVGVYIAYLSAKATDALDAELHDGFYYFTAYCLISLLSLQFMYVRDPRGEPTRTDGAETTSSP